MSTDKILCNDVFLPVVIANEVSFTSFVLIRYLFCTYSLLILLIHYLLVLITYLFVLIGTYGQASAPLGPIEALPPR